jgi:HEAT repeat protein
MGFREFITSFRYRRQLQAELEWDQDIQPPVNPSRQYIDRLVGRLLDKKTAWDAHRELSLMGPVIVPSLIAALQDSRFHRAEWEEYSSTPAPLESTLELLVERAGNEVVKVALPLAKSPSAAVRKTVALQLSSTGLASTIPALKELMQDRDGYVRSYICIGIDRALGGGRADEVFRREAYDLLLPQCDQDWNDATNDAAETVVTLDSARAAINFNDDRWLNLGNQEVHGILKACNRANILLSEDIVCRLLDAALPLAVGDRCYPNDYVAAGALRALALHRTEHVRPIAESLLDHEKSEIKEAAAEALGTLAGIPDPVRFTIDRVDEVGYEGLSNEQRVVYCAFLFDAEVCNGGLMQFFGNSSGDHAVDTLKAIAELDHKEAYTALDTAIRLVGPLARESDRELRLTGFEGRWDELDPAFTPLEKAYYATKAKLRQTWLLYAVKHANEFR